MRCWHAKTEGWAASTFHSKCDGKGPTVTIIKVGSYIFGGYTDVSWSSPSKCHFITSESPTVCCVIDKERMIMKSEQITFTDCNVSWGDKYSFLAAAAIFFTKFIASRYLNSEFPCVIRNQLHSLSKDLSRRLCPFRCTTTSVR